jgi:hypothetical protein
MFLKLAIRYFSKAKLAVKVSLSAEVMAIGRLEI